ncbi:hypothetical protein EDC96DRAFT_532343, partial [Choanephora cucurbitarum]
ITCNEDNDKVYILLSEACSAIKVTCPINMLDKALKEYNVRWSIDTFLEQKEIFMFAVTSTMQKQKIGRLFHGAVMEGKFHLNCFSLCIFPYTLLIPQSIKSKVHPDVLPNDIQESAKDDLEIPNNNEDLQFGDENDEQRLHADDAEITSEESTEEENSDLPQDTDMSNTEAAIFTRSSPRSGLYIGSDNESLAEELRFLYESKAKENEDNSNSSIVTNQISIASALEGILIQGDCSSVSAPSMSDTQESFGEGPSFHTLESEGNSLQTLVSRREIKIFSYFRSSTLNYISISANNNLSSKSLLDNSQITTPSSKRRLLSLTDLEDDSKHDRRSKRIEKASNVSRVNDKNNADINGKGKGKAKTRAAYRLLENYVFSLDNKLKSGVLSRFKSA